MKITLSDGFENCCVYRPDHSGTFPGILMLHGSEGGYNGGVHVDAVLLAMHGFVTMALHYGTGGNTWHAPNIVDVSLDRTAEALKWMFTACPWTKGKKIGAFGTSRGAEQLLLLASLMSKEGMPHVPQAVAVHAPSHTIEPGFVADSDLAGRPVADSPDNPTKAWLWHGNHENVMPGTPIEVERITAPIFISHGEEDTIWDCERTRILESRLKTAHKKPEIYYYAKQNHGFDSESTNLNRERLAAFFSKHLL